MGEPGKIPDGQKDAWDIFQIIMQALTAVAAAAIAAVLGLSQQKSANATLELSRSNFNLAKSQVKVSLLQLLSSQAPVQRIMVLSLANELDKQLALDMARAIGKSDINEEVLQKVRTILGSLSQSEENDIKQQAAIGVDQFDLMDELRTQGLLSKLSEARSYMEGGSPDGDEQALRRYHEVINRLSYNALKKLDQSLLRMAQ